MTQQIDINALIEKYVALRDDCERIDDEAKTKKKPLEAAMEIIGNALLKVANDQGVSSFKGTSGTAFKQKVTRCSVANWDDTQKFIKENDAFYLLNQAVNKTAVQNYINTHEMPPPGVKWDVAYEMQVRRAKS